MPITLVVADSDRKLCAELQLQLEGEGFGVLVTHSAKQCQKVVYDQRPQLLILDANFRDICPPIKHDKTLGFLPIIILSDERLDEDEDTDAVLAKPVATDELLSTIRLLLRVKRQIEHLIHENRKLVEASQAVEVLKAAIIRNVSHEFGTPLVQVKAAISLLNEDVQKANNREQIKLTNMAALALGRLEAVVDNLRQLAQTYNFSMSPVVVEEAADLAIRMVERSWASREASTRIEKYISKGLPFVLGDKRAIARLLQLLLDNALKFSPPDKPVYLQAEYDAEQVWIGVQDFGIGIPASDHRRIFEAFYQVDASTTRNYGGTGTGLALATLLARGMNTQIALKSKVGKGSTFSFCLPIANGDEF
ncbi:MAG TPA: hybrid sensor histidine kinase/response regulator [Aggregatilineaceae bacterium]|nr:hybrid sensor histidine kinase/response regulator [Aggregatilineaceae bacterium]